ncbi:Txe/YoeB family addiction module toxin [Pleurocapsales cyanobacterium LEGE 10410]|nr:Txe/YoeB family addiction module toxin [Pleurocapsales cyanobacterium LEGE 10410]
MNSRQLAWTNEAWNSYVYWQAQDKKTFKRINELIQAAQNNPVSSIGQLEPLRESLSGFWSRRINNTSRLVYTIDEQCLTIISCQYYC